jgi:hypothetical protein
MEWEREGVTHGLWEKLGQTWKIVALQVQFFIEFPVIVSAVYGRAIAVEKCSVSAKEE